jgi:deazaflavin-dependent oxidoreductase (nitroreductase family)
MQMQQLRSFVSYATSHKPAFPTTLPHRPSIQHVRAVERVAFKYGNTVLMIPLLRRGFARFISSPASGYFLLLQTIGRKTHQPRLTPLNYAIEHGCVICLAGFGEHAHWLANIRNDPHVQVRLPERVFDGIATEVADPAEARRLAVLVARNCGFALVFEHPRCLLMSDAQLASQLEGRPVVRITPVDGLVVAGRHDPGGRGWILPMLLWGLALVGGIALRRYRRQTRRAA